MRISARIRSIRSDSLERPLKPYQAARLIPLELEPGQLQIQVYETMRGPESVEEKEQVARRTRYEERTEGEGEERKRWAFYRLRDESTGSLSCCRSANEVK